jgi:hypothetical protein
VADSKLNPNARGVNSLVLTLDGSLPSDKFLTAVKAFFQMIKSVSDSATNTTNSIEWLIEVREGSAIVEAQATPRNIPLEKVPTAIQAVGEGLHALESGSRERPAFFNDSALKAVKDLSSLVENDIFVRIGGGGQVERLSAQSTASVNSVLEASYTDFGTIEGKLEAISGRRGYKFTLYEDLTDHGVKCFFSTELLNEVFNAFECRVSVWGEIRYRKDGTPNSIQVEGLRVFRKSEDLPTIEEMIGILRDAT